MRRHLAIKYLKNVHHGNESGRTRKVPYHNTSLSACIRVTFAVYLMLIFSVTRVDKYYFRFSDLVYRYYNSKISTLHSWIAVHAFLTIYSSFILKLLFFFVLLNDPNFISFSFWIKNYINSVSTEEFSKSCFLHLLY